MQQLQEGHCPFNRYLQALIPYPVIALFIYLLPKQRYFRLGKFALDICFQPWPQFGSALRYCGYAESEDFQHCPGFFCQVFAAESPIWLLPHYFGIWHSCWQYEGCPHWWSLGGDICCYWPGSYLNKWRRTNADGIWLFFWLVIFFLLGVIFVLLGVIFVRLYLV